LRRAPLKPVILEDPWQNRSCIEHILINQHQKPFSCQVSQFGRGSDCRGRRREVPGLPDGTPNLSCPATVCRYHGLLSARSCARVVRSH
jgi:hypothetical protein